MRAYVPPQRVSDGVFTIRVVEGYVAALSVQGGSPSVQARIRGYLAPALASHPLRLGLIERGLLLANDLGGVTAGGVLRPSASVPGAADLIVTVEQPRVTGGISIDNRGSHFSGLWTVTADAEAQRGVRRRGSASRRGSHRLAAFAGADRRPAALQPCHRR